jgi:hypothetical protein
MVLTAPAGRQTVWWVMTVVLAVIGTALVMRLDDALFDRSALAQPATPGVSPMAGARGIYAFTGQLTAKSYGLFMLDVDTGTIWCYELARARDSEMRLKLVAARSWIFDRHLEEFNVAGPTPSEVRVMVQRQTSHAASAGSVPGAAPGGAELTTGSTDRVNGPAGKSKVALPNGATPPVGPQDE